MAMSLGDFHPEKFHFTPHIDSDELPLLAKAELLCFRDILQ
jgi:hypothetical protein